MQECTDLLFRVSRRALPIICLVLIIVLNTGGKTYAATCSGPIDATGGSASCDIGINITATAGTLTATLPSNVTLANGTGGGAGTITGGAGTAGSPYTYTLNGSSQTFAMSFNTTVIDARGGTTGWNLQAAVSSLPSGSVAQFTGIDASCNSTCVPAVTGTGTGGLSHTTFPLVLTSTNTEFIGAPVASSGINAGNFALTTYGTLLLPNTISAGTTINGKLTITLVNANY